MKKFIKNHYILIIISIILLVFLIFIAIGFKKMYFSSDGDVYGNRLEGINDVLIENETLENVKKELNDNPKVESAKIRIQGKIVYFTIDYKEDASLNEAKEIATKTLVGFTDKQKAFYDFNYFLTQNSVSENESFPITGSKHPKNTTVHFINN